MNSSASTTGGKRLHAGDTVVYIVCDDGSSLPPTQRAYHPELEFAKRTDLKIDTKYYLEQQVHPVISRLCDPIEGTDSARIAECLGLDATGFRQAMRRAEEHDDEDAAMLGQLQESETEKYKHCEPFTFPCHSCGSDIVIGKMENIENKKSSIGECPSCKISPLSNLPYVRNQLALAMRRHMSKYFEGWQICEDTACAYRTRRTPLVLNRAQPVCIACNHGILHPEISDKSIYQQLSYFKYMFDAEATIGEETFDGQLKNAGCILSSDANKMLSKSAYSEVNLAKLFEGLVYVKQ